MITKSTKFHNKIAQKYEKDYQTPYWNLYHEISWEHIKKYLPKDKKHPILDAGGGTGYWSRKLAEFGFNVVCSDVAEKMLEVGKKIVKNTPSSQKIKFVISDIANMKEFGNNSFSMVIAEGDPVGYSCNNISIDSIIGKTIFTRFMPRDKIDELLANKSFYKQILKLELEFNSEPSIIGFAGHIEIAGIKN